MPKYPTQLKWLSICVCHAYNFQKIGILQELMVVIYVKKECVL